MSIAICLFVKNEERGILEWLAFHHCVGFDAFLIYNNGSTDNTYALLKRASRFVNMEIVDWPRRDGYAQCGAYVNACHNHCNSFEWIAFIDSDEFLYHADKTPIADLVADKDGIDAIIVQWACYGSASLTYPPAFVIESFTQRSPENFNPNKTFKSIIRPSELVKPLNVHRFIVEGKTVDVFNRIPNFTIAGGSIEEVPDFSSWRVNHYFTRSRTQWEEKIARQYYDGVIPRTEQDWKVYDRNDVRDDSASVYLGEVKRLCNEWMT